MITSCAKKGRQLKLEFPRHLMKYIVADNSSDGLPISQGTVKFPNLQLRRNRRRRWWSMVKCAMYQGRYRVAKQDPFGRVGLKAHLNLPDLEGRPELTMVSVSRKEVTLKGRTAGLGYQVLKVVVEPPVNDCMRKVEKSIGNLLGRNMRLRQAILQRVDNSVLLICHA